MNLRDQLKDILPEILPTNPADPIKGTELIRLIKFSLKQEYSDATLRYHFSIMCCDPASPIAKVEQGQGYYLRRVPPGLSSAGPATLAQAKLGLMFETTPELVDRALARALKFRAIFERDMDLAGKFPFVFESSFAPGAPYENLWKCPDAAVLDWGGGEPTDNGLHISPKLLELKRTMGVPPFTMASVKLKVSVSHDSYREDFYQALSHARWGHLGELVVATPIRDEQLAEELRQLGTEYGLGIQVYNLEEEDLDELPPGYIIQQMTPREFEAVLARVKRQRLTSPRSRILEWGLIEQVREGNAEFQELFVWVQRCLEDGKAYRRAEFARLMEEIPPEA
ncbi:MAG: hypothetical protein JWL81_297 [Verrucomicrobiales bacterium]|nr:hypothetical protein [Verrucomicrobiales bacterium]